MLPSIDERRVGCKLPMYRILLVLATLGLVRSFAIPGVSVERRGPLGAHSESESGKRTTKQFDYLSSLGQQQKTTKVDTCNDESNNAINGASSTINGVSSSGINGKLNGVAETQPQSNGVAKPASTNLNGVAEPLKNGVKENRSLVKRKVVGPTATATAPEVTHWTEIMSEGFSTDSLNATTKTTTSWNDVLSVYDFEQIEEYWKRLLPAVSYLGTTWVARVYQALCVAYRAHRGQVRKSGEPFIIHPVEVAMLLSSLKMDGETIISGLLHDTVEDTDLTFEKLESMFGETVRSIVEGETKVSKLPKLAFTDHADEQAENLRQMFVAMTDDYRIIIVKLADRLHNMRTLRYMKPAKQIKISRETLDIFAPLAHRMGIWQFKSELEDTAFMYLYPQEYKNLNRRLRQHQKKFRETLDKSQKILQRQLERDSTLRQQAAQVEVYGRTKEIYSLWHKMETKGERDLDQIGDVVALRVIITPSHKRDEDDNESDRGVWLCYHVLGLVQHLPGFTPVPTKVKDYISFPKPNGYQSLHTALILNGQTIEVQIRTKMMHRVAEFGMASHWAYTDGKRSGADAAELYNTPWLASIKEWQNDRISSRDFVDSVRRELLGKRVFVFLRNGKILNLARGATAVDAAFQIHTEVGLNMHGVEINGKAVPFSYELQNGDVVSILTGEGRPSKDWMLYAKSRSTRSKLRSYFRARQKDILRDAGKILLEDYLKIHGHLISRSSYLEEGFVLPSSVEELGALLPGRTRFNDVDDLMLAVAKHHDRSILHQVMAQLFRVPKNILFKAEQNKQVSVPGSVVAEVQERQRNTEVGMKGTGLSSHATNGDQSNSQLLYPVNRANSKPPKRPSIVDGQPTFDSSAEIADPENICEDCLPIYGDQIVGTRTPGNDWTTTVHRVGCPHAQRAVNNASALQRNQLQGFAKRNLASLVDSVSLRKQQGGRIWRRRPGSRKTGKYDASLHDLPVTLEWPDSEERSTFLFNAEVVVHAVDRKMLLADCSVVVSETAEIVRTGSSSSEEHASLVFLVKVKGLQQLQTLMDKLGLIPSVMSVERRFGSELM